MEEVKQETGETSGASADATTQSAHADAKAIAERAKAATGGFDFNKLFVGRVDNMNYFYAAIASLAIGLTIGKIPLIGMLISLAMCVLGIGLMVRRFHDINISGFATLILLVPIVNVIAVIYLCWKKGDAAANPFGAAPDPKRDFFKAVLNT